MLAVAARADRDPGSHKDCRASVSIRIRLLLRQEPLKRELETHCLALVGRFLLRGMRIGVSTLSIVELLRND